ncbi:MAG: hypothetical protein IJD23_07620 [Spirochaetaceae bacterium]|nr:hypothetical protein [Spirochaetaceae bacterium]
MAWGLAEFDAERRGYKEGVAVGISQGISQGIAQGLQQGISQGAQQKAIETAKNLLSMSLSIENIAKATGLSVEEIKSISK